MKKKGFHGYNCYSAVIGELSIQNNKNNIVDLINSQVSFLFDKDLFWANSWFAGSMINDKDELLDYDLKKILGINFQKIDADINSIEFIEEILKSNTLVIGLIDFFYFDSVDWKTLEKFNVYPQHDSHYVIIESVTKDSILYSDPYYDYRGSVSFEKFKKAIRSQTRQGEINCKFINVNSIRNEENVKIDLKDIIKMRFERYLALDMVSNVESLGVELDKRRLYNGIEENRDWALTAYNCLRSAEDQYYNLSVLTKSNGICDDLNFLELNFEWDSVRKKFIEYYYGRNLNLNDIAYSIIKISYKERKLANKIANVL